jgi:hypothetical protein
VSTLSKKRSKWLRRDLVYKIEGLGLPVTTVMPRLAAGQGITDSKAFDFRDDLDGRWRWLTRVVGARSRRSTSDATIVSRGSPRPVEHRSLTCPAARPICHRQDHALVEAAAREAGARTRGRLLRFVQTDSPPGCSSQARAAPSTLGTKHA